MEGSEEGQTMAMTETVHVEAARIPDRDRLLRELQEAGLEARPVDEVCIEVPCGDDTDAACDDLMVHAENVITSIGAPFVPMKHEGVIYIRPPLS
ncbi:MAG TPA: hypothetical protein VNR63_08790 [Gaiellaceae bacterium]|nr:hypothetical protein [Gaiellaceae bacterium]